MSTTNRHKPRRTSDKAVRRATGRGRNEWFALLDLRGAPPTNTATSPRGLCRDTMSATGGLRGSRSITSRRASCERRAVTAKERSQSPRVRPLEYPSSSCLTPLLTPHCVNVGCQERQCANVLLSRGALRASTGRAVTPVNVGFTAKGNRTSQVALRHECLPNAKEAERMKAYWRGRRVALKALMKR